MGEQETYDIVFMPDQVTVSAAAGETVLDVANRGKLHINASCGGEGVCGRCVVELKGGTVEAAPGLYLSDEEFAQNLRLACRAKVNGPATIFIPLESRGDASFFKKAAQAEEAVTPEVLDPTVRQTCLILSPPDQADNVSDLDRVNAALAEVGIVDQDVDLAALRRLPEVLRASDFKVKVTINNDLAIWDTEAKPYGRIVSFDPSEGTNDYFALALDIGTTSV